MKFRIVWRSKRTGQRGAGDAYYHRREDALRICRQMNKELPDVRHWVEEVPSDHHEKPGGRWRG